MNKKKPTKQESSSESDEKNQFTLKKKEPLNPPKNSDSESSKESDDKKRGKKPLISKPDKSKNKTKRTKGKKSNSSSSDSESSDNEGKTISKKNNLKAKKKKTSDSESNNSDQKIDVKSKGNIKLRPSNLDSNSSGNKRITNSDESSSETRPKMNRGKIVIGNQARKSSSSSSEKNLKTKVCKGKIIEVQKKDKKSETDSEEENCKKCNNKIQQNNSDDDDQETTLKPRKEKVLPLKLIHIQTKKEFAITQNLEVKRRKSDLDHEIVLDGKTLGINDIEISRTQCEFKPFQKGHFLVDKGSSNGTYIKLKKEYQTLVYPGMILEIGEYFLEINKVSVKTIHWHLYQDEEDKEQIGEKISNFKNKDKIKFGKSPGEKNDILIDDSNLLDVQGYFEKKDDAIYVIVCNDKNPLWLKIKDRNYILAKNMIIRLAQYHQFNVTQVGNIKLKKCPQCEGTADLVFSPCFHNTVCSECRDTKLKKCPECKKEINSMDVYYDLTGYS